MDHTRSTSAEDDHSKEEVTMTTHSTRKEKPQPCPRRSSTDRRLSMAERSTASHISESGSTSHLHGTDSQTDPLHHFQRRCKRRSSLPWDHEPFTDAFSTTDTSNTHPISNDSANNDSNIVGSLAMAENGKIAGVAIGKQGIPFEVSQLPLSDFSPEENPSHMHPCVSHPAIPPLPTFLTQRFTISNASISSRVSRALPQVQGRRRYSAYACSSPILNPNTSTTVAGASDTPTPSSVHMRSHSLQQRSHDPTSSPNSEQLNRGSSISRSARDNSPSASLSPRTLQSFTTVVEEAPTDSVPKLSSFRGERLSRWNFVSNVTSSASELLSPADRRLWRSSSQLFSRLSGVQPTSSAGDTSCNRSTLPTEQKPAEQSTCPEDPKNLPSLTFRYERSSSSRSRSRNCPRRLTNKRLSGDLSSILSSSQLDDAITSAASGVRGARRRHSAAREASFIQRPPLALSRKTAPAIDPHGRSGGTPSRGGNQAVEQGLSKEMINRIDPKIQKQGYGALGHSFSAGNLKRWKNNATVEIPTKVR